MKPSFVTPILAIFVGFGLGWLLKPAVVPAPGPVATAPAPRKTMPLGSPTAASQSDPSDPRIPVGPVRHVAPVQPITDVVERGRKLEEAKVAAKMQRFAEAIGLTVVQQAELKKVITENEKAFVANGTGEAKETLGSLVSGGSALEKALAALLTPGQTTAFAELRKRENDNRIEATAQRNLGNLTEITDLSAEQRDKALEVLRQATAAEVAAMPSCLSLILDSSILPLGCQAASEQSIQTLRLIAEAPELSEPRAQHAKLIENQRRKLEERVNLLKAILTPGQLAQYQATLAERYAIQDLMVPPQR